MRAVPLISSLPERILALELDTSKLHNSHDGQSDYSSKGEYRYRSSYSDPTLPTVGDPTLRVYYAIRYVFRIRLGRAPSATLLHFRQASAQPCRLTRALLLECVVERPARGEDGAFHHFVVRAYWTAARSWCWKPASSSSSWQAPSLAEFGVGALRRGHSRSLHVLIWLRYALQHASVLD